MNNFAASGGAIVVSGNGAIFILNCYLIGNKAKYGIGGAILVQSVVNHLKQHAYLYLGSSILYYNEAQSGGAIAVHTLGENHHFRFQQFGQIVINVSRCIVAYNNASKYGGAVYVGVGNMLLTESNITNNTADMGGGLYLDVGSVQSIDVKSFFLFFFLMYEHVLQYTT